MLSCLCDNAFKLSLLSVVKVQGEHVSLCDTKEEKCIISCQKEGVALYIIQVSHRALFACIHVSD